VVTGADDDPDAEAVADESLTTKEGWRRLR
jgi:hypothetical protein